MSVADCKQAAVARISALNQVQARIANPPKDIPVKKSRGKKAGRAGKAGATKKDDEDVIELD